MVVASLFRRCHAIAVLGLLAGAPAAYCQTAVPKEPILDVQKLMSMSDFKEAGLQKLSPEEIRSLNAWPSQYAVLVYNAATKDAGANPTPSESVIETRMDGDFEGWSGDTIFKLANGQIWQQASYSYTYHYAYRPKVLIYKSGSTYRMKVEGVDSDIAVKRLK